MGREKSSSLFTFDSKKCCCLAMPSEMASSCCQNEVQLISIDSDQSHSGGILTSVPVLVALGMVYGYIAHLPLAKSERNDRYALDASPPTRVPIYKLNSSYVFYDSEHSA